MTSCKIIPATVQYQKGIHQDWGDGPVSKSLAVQEWGPELIPRILINATQNYTSVTPVRGGQWRDRVAWTCCPASLGKNHEHHVQWEAHLKGIKQREESRAQVSTHTHNTHTYTQFKKHRTPKHIYHVSPKLSDCVATPWRKLEGFWSGTILPIHRPTFQSTFAINVTSHSCHWAKTDHPGPSRDEQEILPGNHLMTAIRSLWMYTSLPWNLFSEICMGRTSEELHADKVKHTHCSALK